MLRKNAKLAFKKFRKENPQYRAITFSAFNKLVKEGYMSDNPKKHLDSTADVELDDILVDDIEEVEEDGTEASE